MKKYLVVALFVLGSLKSAFAQVPCELRIGGLLPLTGSLAEQGTEIRDGMNLALKDSLPVSVRLSFEDTQFSARLTVTAAQKLLTTFFPQVLVPIWDTTEPVAPIAERAKVITFAIRWNPYVTEGKQFTFTFESTFMRWDDSAVALLKQMNVKKVAVVSEISTGWTLAKEYFVKKARIEGIEITDVEDLSGDERDPRTSVLKLVSSKPDMLMVLGQSPITVSVLRSLKVIAPQLKATGYFSIIEGSDTGFVDGMPFVDQVGFIPEFSSRFQKEFGYRAKSRGVHGYELVRMLSDAAKVSCVDGKLDTTKMTSYLDGIKDRPSNLGPLTTNSTRNIEHPPVWKVWHSGEMVPYDK